MGTGYVLRHGQVGHVGLGQGVHRALGFLGGFLRRYQLVGVQGSCIGVRGVYAIVLLYGSFFWGVVGVVFLGHLFGTFLSN